MLQERFILNFGMAFNSTGRPSSLSPCSTSAKNLGPHKSGKLALTSDAIPTRRISRQSSQNANVRRIPMSKEQVKFVCDAWHDLMLLVRKPKEQPSLLARSISFSTRASRMERLVAFGQLDNWLSNKHKTTNHE